MLFLRYFLTLIPLFFIAGESDTTVSNETEVVNDDLIAWESDYNIKWSDFKAAPKNSSPLDAYTMLGISLEVVSQDNGKVNMGVFGYFEKNKSWVKSGEKTENLLKHEQKHFDLCEIYRRILVKRLEAESPYSYDNFNTKVGEIFNKTFKDYTDEQGKYDHETNHSQKKDKQAEWDANVIKRLNALEKYNNIVAELEVK